MDMETTTNTSRRFFLYEWSDDLFVKVGIPVETGYLETEEVASFNKTVLGNAGAFNAAFGLLATLKASGEDVSWDETFCPSRWEDK